jgi:serine/threonine protein kinase/Tol biopolymer transport system component
MHELSELQRALADRYQIERQIGAGGMATVYLARDLRHERPVALKLLNPELGAVLGEGRFLAEIKVTANLQHPNLLPLFDSGAVGGQLFYVMPYVEGESLRARLEREKQLPIDDAIRIAVAAANALDYAHAQGVIHRDLKPENILLQAGQPVVADFGIALAVSKAGGSRVTQTGLSLGTPQYMSPEQATGDRVIDGRSDIYSLAAVTYEMITGEPPHSGTTAQAIIARVLTDRPRLVRQSRPAVPEHVEAALERALEKLPADRFATAHEFADALLGKGPTRATGAARLPAASWRTRLRDPLVLGLAALSVLAFGFSATRVRRAEPAAALPTIRFFYGGSDSAPSVGGTPWPGALSPDGGTLVFYGLDRGSTVGLYARRLDQLQANLIPGTTGRPTQPYFSPDGQWLGFSIDGKEKKVRLDGSAPVTITEHSSSNGVTWTTAGDLVIGSTGPIHGLSRVSAAGGERSVLTVPDSAHGETDHLWPVAAPDGRTIAFTRSFGSLATAKLALTRVGDGKVVPLELKGVRPLAILDGMLVYLQVDGAVMAVALDGSTGVKGDPVPVHDPVLVLPNNNGNSEIYISQGGGLVTALGSRRTRLNWLGRDGSNHPVSGELREFTKPVLSPDQKQIAVIVREDGKSDVWIYDLATGTLSRFTSSGSVTSARWSADGKRIVYTGLGSGAARGAVGVQSVETASAPQTLVQHPGLLMDADLSPDGKWVVAQVLGEGGWEIMKARVDSGAGAPVRLTPYVATPANELIPRFSPNGKWVALQSTESGRSEVYVRSFPDPTVKVQVSAGGGGSQVWSADGTKLYYRAGEKVIETRLAMEPAPRVVARDTVFRAPAQTTSTLFNAAFDVTRDGLRLLTANEVSSSYQLVVVPNWITEFRARISAARR